MHNILLLIALSLSPQCVKFQLIPFNTLRDMVWTNLLLQKSEKGDNSVITCDRGLVVALYTFSDDLLSMYQAPFNSVLYCQRFAPDKTYYCKNLEGEITL